MTWGDSSHHTIKTTPCLYFDIFCNILWLCSHILYSVFYKCGASWSGFTATALRSNANGQKDDSQKTSKECETALTSFISHFGLCLFVLFGLQYRKSLFVSKFSTAIHPPRIGYDSYHWSCQGRAENRKGTDNGAFGLLGWILWVLAAAPEKTAGRIYQMFHQQTNTSLHNTMLWKKSESPPAALSEMQKAIWKAQIHSWQLKN